MKELPEVYKDMSNDELKTIITLLKEQASESESLISLINREVIRRDKNNRNPNTVSTNITPYTELAVANLILRLTYKLPEAQRLLLRLAAAYAKQDTAQTAG